MRRLSTTQPDFDQRLAELLAFEAAQDPQIDITPDVLRMLNGAAVAGAPAAQPKPIR